jgi:hypothetical protein
LIPCGSAEASGGKFKGVLDVVEDAFRGDDIRAAEILSSEETGESGETISKGDSCICLKAAFSAGNIAEETGDIGSDFVIEGIEDAEEGDGSSGGIGAAAFHGSNFNEATVIALSVEEELGECIFSGDRLSEDFVDESSEKGVVGASERSIGAFGKASIGGSEYLQGGEPAIRQVWGVLCKEIGAAGGLDNECGVEPAEEINGIQFEEGLSGKPCCERLEGVFR